MKALSKIFVVLGLILLFIFGCGEQQKKSTTITGDAAKDQVMRNMVQEILTTQGVRVQEASQDSIAKKTYREFASNFEMLSADDMERVLNSNRRLRGKVESFVEDEVGEIKEVAEKEIANEEIFSISRYQNDIIDMKALEIYSQGYKAINLLDDRDLEKYDYDGDGRPDVLKTSGAVSSDKIYVSLKFNFLPKFPGDYQIGCVYHGYEQKTQSGDRLPERGKLSKTNKLGLFSSDHCYNWEFDGKNGPAMITVYLYYPDTRNAKELAKRGFNIVG